MWFNGTYFEVLLDITFNEEMEELDTLLVKSARAGRCDQTIHNVDEEE